MDAVAQDLTFSQGLGPPPFPRRRYSLANLPADFENLLQMRFWYKALVICRLNTKPYRFDW